jgi:hypothetical protein
MIISWKKTHIVRGLWQCDSYDHGNVTLINCFVWEDSHQVIFKKSNMSTWIFFILFFLDIYIIGLHNLQPNSCWFEPSMIRKGRFSYKHDSSPNLKRKGLTCHWYQEGNGTNFLKFTSCEKMVSRLTIHLSSKYERDSCWCEFYLSNKETNLMLVWPTCWFKYGS